MVHLSSWHDGYCVNIWPDALVWNPRFQLHGRKQATQLSRSFLLGRPIHRFSLWVHISRLWVDLPTIHPFILLLDLQGANRGILARCLCLKGRSPLLRYPFQDVASLHIVENNERWRICAAALFWNELLAQVWGRVERVPLLSRLQKLETRRDPSSWLAQCRNYSSPVKKEVRTHEWLGRDADSSLVALWVVRVHWIARELGCDGRCSRTNPQHHRHFHEPVQVFEFDQIPSPKHLRLWNNHLRLGLLPPLHIRICHRRYVLGAKLVVRWPQICLANFLRHRRFPCNVDHAQLLLVRFNGASYFALLQRRRGRRQLKLGAGICGQERDHNQIENQMTHTYTHTYFKGINREYWDKRVEE